MATSDLAIEAIRNHVEDARAETAVLASVLSDPADTPADRERRAVATIRGARHLDRVGIYYPSGKRLTVLSAADSAAPPAPATLSEEVRGAAMTEGSAILRAESHAGAVWLVLVHYEHRADRAWGYLWTAIDLSPLSDVVRTLSERHFDGDNHRVWVIDGDLRIVAHGRAAHRLTSAAEHPLVRGLDPSSLRQDVTSTADYTVDGEARLGVLARVPELRLGVLVEQDQTLAFAAADETVRSAAKTGAAFALAVLIVGLLLGRRLAAPIAALLDASRARLVSEAAIRRDLSRYLDDDLVERVIRREADLHPGGERRTITVLFADVVAFTELTQTRPPEEVVSVLNEVFTFLTEIVFSNGGAVDKFMGDCMMAIFGAPDAHDDAPQQAVRAAEQMIRWIETGNARWAKRLGRPLELGIGIATGEAIVGNVGSDRRMDYTAIGYTVNIAARLEALAAPSQILLSPQTAACVADDVETENLGPQTLRGIDAPVEIHAVVL